MNSDASYFAQRERDELQAAERAKDRAARIAHLDLAARYALRCAHSVEGLSSRLGTIAGPSADPSTGDVAMFRVGPAEERNEAEAQLKAITATTIEPLLNIGFPALQDRR